MININSLTHPIATNGTETVRSPLLEQIARRADVNRDGTVTNSEFSEFLSGLMKSLEEESAKSVDVAAPAVPATPAESSIRDAAPLSVSTAAAALRAALASVAQVSTTAGLHHPTTPGLKER